MIYDRTKMPWKLLDLAWGKDGDFREKEVHASGNDRGGKLRMAELGANSDWSLQSKTGPYLWRA